MRKGWIPNRAWDITKTHARRKNNAQKKKKLTARGETNEEENSFGVKKTRLVGRGQILRL